MASTRTYAILEVSEEIWEEIYEKLLKLGNDERFYEDNRNGTLIDMHGLVLKVEKG